MRRREFIALLGGAASWPITARAQQGSMPVVGFLHSGSSTPYAGRMAGFREGLGDTGFFEDKNVAIEYRWAEGNYERLPKMALDLVRRAVSVIVAGGGIASAPVAKAATSTIPTVFLTGVEPVAAALSAHLPDRGANATGVLPDAERLGLLNVLSPNVGCRIPLHWNFFADVYPIKVCDQTGHKSVECGFFVATQWPP